MITFLLTFALVGFLVWLILNYIPMPEPFGKVLVVVVVIVLILYLLQMFGADLPLPRSRP